MKRRVLIALVVSACGSSLRTVPRAAPPESLARVFADYPPPPAQIEVVPPDPGAPCAWLDGHWELIGHRWTWTPGAWIKAPAGCHVTLSLVTWGTDRTGQPVLAYAPPHWFPDQAVDSAGKPATCAEPVLCKDGAAQSDLQGD